MKPSFDSLTAWRMNAIKMCVRRLISLKEGESEEMVVVVVIIVVVV